MNINLFDENIEHRKILPYDPSYAEIFSAVKCYVESSISTVELFHIGSTAVPDLRGKPMVDIAAVTTAPDLRKEQKIFEDLGFHCRDVWVDTEDKPYVCGSVCTRDAIYNINIHICHQNASVHKNSLSFIQRLNENENLRREYEKVKDHAHSIDPANPEVYNKAKEGFISEVYKEFT